MLRPKGRKLEARSAESGPAWGRCKLPQWGPAAAKSFVVFFVFSDDRSCYRKPCLVLCKCVISHMFVIFCGPNRGPRSSGPWPTGSLNRLNPRFLRHWVWGLNPPNSLPPANFAYVNFSTCCTCRYIQYLSQLYNLINYICYINFLLIPVSVSFYFSSIVTLRCVNFCTN